MNGSGGESADLGQIPRLNIDTQQMLKRRKKQAQNFFEKYKDDKEALMIFMEHFKKEEHLESNTDRLERLSKMDNSYLRFPMQDVL